MKSRRKQEKVTDKALLTYIFWCLYLWVCWNCLTGWRLVVIPTTSHTSC